MLPMNCFRDFGVPRVWDWSREAVFDLISVEGYFLCVLTRLLERLVLEDRARGFSASGGSEYR